MTLRLSFSCHRRGPPQACCQRSRSRYHVIETRQQGQDRSSARSMTLSSTPLGSLCQACDPHWPRSIRSREGGCRRRGLFGRLISTSSASGRSRARFATTTRPRVAAEAGFTLSRPRGHSNATHPQKRVAVVRPPPSPVGLRPPCDPLGHGHEPLLPVSCCCRGATPDFLFTIGCGWSRRIRPRWSA
jgi:hypothetical protein